MTFSLLIFLIGCSADLLESLPKCHVSDLKCLENYCGVLFRAHDPLFVEKMVVNQGGGGTIGLDLVFQNASIFGMKDVKVYSVKGLQKDPEGNKLEIRLKAPAITTRSKYSANGKILFLNIQARGNINMTFRKIHFEFSE